MIPNPKPAKGTQRRLRAKRKRVQRKADKAVYQSVAERDGKACTKCGYYSAFAQMHHQVFRSLGGKTTVENIVTLCPYHHAEAHRLR